MRNWRNSGWKAKFTWTLQIPGRRRPKVKWQSVIKQKQPRTTYTSELRQRNLSVAKDLFLGCKGTTIFGNSKGFREKVWIDAQKSTNFQPISPDNPWAIKLYSVARCQRIASGDISSCYFSFFLMLSDSRINRCPATWKHSLSEIAANIVNKIKNFDVFDKYLLFWLHFFYFSKGNSRWF